MGSWLLPLISAEKCEEFRKMGDVNRNGYIDDEDMKLIQIAYGSKPGDPKWNPDCDLNGDGRITGMDLLTCSINYGKDIFTWMGWLPQLYIELGIIGGAIATIAGVGYVLYQMFFAPK